MLLLSLIVLVTRIIPGYCEWELTFFDEFSESYLDYRDWHVISEHDQCESENWPTLDCKRNSSTNLRVINGTLVLAAVRELYHKKQYTSALITTTKTFTVPFKVDVRAALPRGKMLHSIIEMKSIDEEQGEIVIASEHQTDELVHGFSTQEDNANPYLANYQADKMLNEFHNYSVEFNDTMLVWKFDDQEIDAVDIASSNITNLNFSIWLSINVGGVLFYAPSLSLNDAYNWECSLMIIDYVKVYTWLVPDFMPYRGQEDIIRPIASNIFNYYRQDNARKICAQVMEEIRPKFKAPRRVHGSIVVFTMVLLLLLIPLLVYLIVRQMKLKKKVETIKVETEDLDKYDDIGAEDDLYVEVNNEHEYLEINPSNKYYYIGDSDSEQNDDTMANYTSMEKSSN